MIKEKLALLPSGPGCYLMKDSAGTIIYVGKAKNLKNRVKSYFTGSNSGKTQLLVNEIVDFEYIITNSEMESLVLELNLIKEHDPRYNILMTDDKSYPYIELTAGNFPRLRVVKNVDKKRNRGKLFGPFPNAGAARDTVNLLNTVYPLRKCAKIPKKECLYYHIGQCLAPCIKDVSVEESNEVNKSVIKFLQGDHKEIMKELTVKMEVASSELNFEKALELRDLMESIKVTTEKQQVELLNSTDTDVFGYYNNEHYLSIQIFYMRNGKLIKRDTNIIPIYHEEVSELFKLFVINFYADNIKPKGILIPANIDTDDLASILGIKVFAPKKGDKKKLVTLAGDNAKESLDKELELIIRNEQKTTGALHTLKDMIGINFPRRIEAFDNSNIQGANAVSGMVVYINGVPSKKDYRKFKVKTVEGPNDYETMKEVIYRRYFRVLMEGLDKPDILIVDGGKTQMKAAYEVLDSLGMDIMVVGLVKNEKHRTNSLLYGRYLDEIVLDSHSPLFLLLSSIQEEVHRYAITFHKSVRSKSLFSSELDNISGIGEKRKNKLLKHFGSLKKLREASIDDISEVVPKNVALEIYNYFQELG